MPGPCPASGWRLMEKKGAADRKKKEEREEAYRCSHRYLFQYDGLLRDVNFSSISKKETPLSIETSKKAIGNEK